MCPHKCYFCTGRSLKKHFHIFYFLLCKLNDYISCSVLLFLSVLLTVIFPAFLKFDKLEVIFNYAFQNVTSARYEIYFWSSIAHISLCAMVLRQSVKSVSTSRVTKHKYFYTEKLSLFSYIYIYVYKLIFIYIYIY